MRPLSSSAATSGAEPHWYFRRIARIAEATGRPEPNEFRLATSKSETGLSVYPDRLPESVVMAGHEQFGLVRITTGDILALGLEIVALPDDDDPVPERGQAHHELRVPGFRPGTDQIPSNVRHRLSQCADVLRVPRSD